MVRASQRPHAGRALFLCVMKVHNFFVRSGFDYQQYIPCLDPLSEPRGQQPWSLTPERFEQYLKTAFDCWHQDAMRGKKRYHRYFDNLLLMLNGQPPEACGMLGTCGMQYVVEADGSVYPCDFYMLDQYKLGNLNTDTLAQNRCKTKKDWIYRAELCSRRKVQDMQMVSTVPWRMPKR